MLSYRIVSYGFTSRQPSGCCGAAGVSSPPVWPHHGRAHQLTLVTSARKDCVQGRSADLSGTALWCPSVPAAVYTSRRHPVPTKTSVFHLGRSVRSCRQTACCWTSCFLCRSCLERSSCRRHFSTFSVHFPKTFKTASFSTLLSWPCPLSHFCPCVVLVVAVCYLGHLKIDWLIDWSESACGRLIKQRITTQFILTWKINKKNLNPAVQWCHTIN